MDTLASLEKVLKCLYLPAIKKQLECGLIFDRIATKWAVEHARKKFKSDEIWR